MNAFFVVFWSAMIFASIAWYALLLFYIGYKGARELKEMIRRLGARDANPPDHR
jgi:hypothetical protein